MSTAIVWFRQDLRLADNPAMLEACTQHQVIVPLYIYDGQHSVLGRAQAWWLHHSLLALSASLQQFGLTLLLRKGDALQIMLELINQHAIAAVYWNRCYQPLTIARDTQLKACLLQRGIKTHSCHASVLHEPWTIHTKNGGFFKVFTPYWKTCRQELALTTIPPLPRPRLGHNITGDALTAWQLLPKPDWATYFPACWTPGETGAQQRLTTFIAQRLCDYKTKRDFPSQEASSRLSPHLHFGEISPRQVVNATLLAMRDADCDLASAEHFLAELGWREFSIYLLYHFPKLASEHFKPAFNAFPWQDDPALLASWQQGLTGYPIIDAGMRELWASGYMHNRVRMISASFLTKGLLIDWRLGAAWFLDTLLDADLASNSAGWQWVAGCGADAAPYFRIFNPVLQSQKFDAQGAYIRRWVPELAALSNNSIHAPWLSTDATTLYTDSCYPQPVIDHASARARALAYYHQLVR